MVPRRRSERVGLALSSSEWLGVQNWEYQASCDFQGAWFSLFEWLRAALSCSE